MSEGDHVVTDQPLVSVETDKTVVEIPSPHSARVTRSFERPGDRLTDGDQLVEFEAVEAAADTGTVVGDIATDSAASVSAPAAPSARPKATPAVRDLARKLDVNLSIVQGTGPNGVTTKADVERATRIPAAAAPAEPLRGVRRAMADRMTKAHAEVPRATVTDEADVEAWEESASVTPRVIRAIVAGCRAAPGTECLDRPGGDDAPAAPPRRSRYRRRYRERSVCPGLTQRLGARTAGPPAGAGLAQTRCPRTDGATERAQGVNHYPLQFRHGRRQICGARSRTVVPPQVAILGVGRRYQWVVLHWGQAGRPRDAPSVTFNHRAVTGVEAATFLRAVLEDLERAE